MKIALCDDDEKELSNIRSLLDSYQKTHNIPFTRTAKLSTTRVEGNRLSAQNCSRPYVTACCNTGNLFRCTARSL